MSVKLKQPYKIIERKLKRYLEHYQIPSGTCVVIPLRLFGEDVSCDVRWEDGSGQMHQQQNLFFKQDNIEPLNAMKDDRLHDIWKHFYAN